jgi:hypothetical protein
MGTAPNQELKATGETISHTVTIDIEKELKYEPQTNK